MCVRVRSAPSSPLQADSACAKASAGTNRCVEPSVQQTSLLRSVQTCLLHRSSGTLCEAWLSGEECAAAMKPGQADGGQTPSAPGLLHDAGEGVVLLRLDEGPAQVGHAAHLVQVCKGDHLHTTSTLVRCPANLLSQTGFLVKARPAGSLAATRTVCAR